MIRQKQEDGKRRAVFATEIDGIEQVIESQSGCSDEDFFNVIITTMELMDHFGEPILPWPFWNGDISLYEHGEWFEPDDVLRDPMEAAVHCGLAENAGALFRWTPKFTRNWIEPVLKEQAERRERLISSRDK